MLTQFLLGQICGFISLFLACVTYLKNEKTTMLVCVLLGNLFALLQYIFLGAATSAVICTIATLRVLVFLVIKNNKYALLFFLLVTLVAGVITYDVPTNVFSVLGGLSVTISTWLKEPKKVRLFAIPGCLFWGLNAISLGAVFSVVSQFLSLGTIFIGWYKYDRNKDAGKEI